MSARSSLACRDGLGVLSTSTERTKLNLGCGESKKPGCVDVPYLASRLWCFWLGGFDEIEFRFVKPAG